MTAVAMTDRERLVYALLRQAGRHAEPCPKNADIARSFGIVSASSVADVIGRLEEKGLIKVQRYAHHRRVHILADQTATAIPEVKSRDCNIAHWSMAGRDNDPPPASLPAHHRRQHEAGPWLPRTCQWIDGEPSDSDACKCGARIERGLIGVSSYCLKHFKRAYRKREQAA